MSEIDPVIHPLNRFKICATLNAFGATQGGDINREMKFAMLRDRTELSDATLSKQLGALEQAGYVTRFREYGTSRAKDSVWVALTEKGAVAFKGHLAALKALAEG
ncbi:transcriptional regulator [Corynebacterium sp. MSK218]|uniref:transcriptional regulator n=1 Tax=Corynebacterium sp. MSK218 TaxID=3050218 RepID=UPI002550144C|nr:transcriptional regulator [Corynebacterium sp. MSK218]MDK8762785.1 transcriptional regulator [Corynebacterium sp. MSK218]